MNSEFYVQMALRSIGGALKWFGSDATNRLLWAEEDISSALQHIKRAKELHNEARDRMAAAAVQPVEA